MKINLETPVGTRVSLMGMTGTFVGTKRISRTAKNVCDGFIEFEVSAFFVGLIKWDEQPTGERPVIAGLSELAAMHEMVQA